MARLRKRDGQAGDGGEKRTTFELLGPALTVGEAIWLNPLVRRWARVWVVPTEAGRFYVDVRPKCLGPFGEDAWSCYRLARLSDEIDAGLFDAGEGSHP